MFAKHSLAAGLFASAPSPVAHRCKRLRRSRRVKFEPIATACAGKDGWGELKAPPAHIYGNVYMVGTCGIVSLLITTPMGHFDRWRNP